MDKTIQTFFEKLRAQDQFNVFKDAYKKLETDQERVEFSLKMMCSCNLVPSATGMPKFANYSDYYREEGNKLFNEADNNIKFIEAMKLYTRSIAFAPYRSEQLASACEKRSAVLFILGLWSECIQDIDTVLRLDYPESLKLDLCIRKANCLISLKKCSEEIEECLNEAQHLLNKMTPHTLIEKTRKLEELKLYCNAIQPVTDDSTDAEVKMSEDVELPTISSYNTEVPCASDAVAIKYSEDYGRHVVATRDIKPGEVIAVEKPYTWIALQSQMQTHCSNCLKICWANIPCKHCTYAMYCSKKCRNDEWEKCHNVECAVFPALIECGAVNYDLLSLRLAVLALNEAEGDLEKLRSMVNTLDDCNDRRTSTFSQNGKLHSDKYAGVYNLMTHTENRDIDDLIKLSVATCFTLYFLATRTDIFGAKLSENLSELIENNYVTFLGGLILRHQQIVTKNVHAFNEVYGNERTRRGYVLMPFCGLFNHSCNPNVVLQPRSEHLVMYALYPIQEDDQIFDSYGPVYAFMSLEERQKRLNEYFFTCDCVPCQNNWAMTSKLPPYEFFVERDDDKDKIDKALRNYETWYKVLMIVGNIEDEPGLIEELLEAIQILFDYTPPTMPCREMTNVIQMLRLAYALNGNRFSLPQISNIECNRI